MAHVPFLDKNTGTSGNPFPTCCDIHFNKRNLWGEIEQDGAIKDKEKKWKNCADAFQDESCNKCKFKFEVKHKTLPFDDFIINYDKL